MIRSPVEKFNKKKYYYIPLILKNFIICFYYIIIELIYIVAFIFYSIDLFCY